MTKETWEKNRRAEEALAAKYEREALEAGHLDTSNDVLRKLDEIRCNVVSDEGFFGETRREMLLQHLRCLSDQIRQNEFENV
ncbi:hypothetical protein ACWPKS_10440 [Coraliomargarita sp. W4R72]